MSFPNYQDWNPAEDEDWPELAESLGVEYPTHEALKMPSACQCGCPCCVGNHTTGKGVVYTPAMIRAAAWCASYRLPIVCTQDYWILLANESYN